MASSRRMPPGEMQSVFTEFSVPEAPYDSEDAIKQDSVQMAVIHVNPAYHGIEVLKHFRKAVDTEINIGPYLNDSIGYDMGATTVKDTQFLIVCIEGFFTSDQDFAYYIIGKRNITIFLGGTFGSQVYNGPLVAAPFRFTSIRKWYKMDNDLVSKTAGIMGDKRWTYLFETGRLAWSKLRLDPKKIAIMKQRKPLMAQLERQEQCCVTSNRTGDVEVCSSTSTEAREMKSNTSGMKRLEINPRPRMIQEPSEVGLGSKSNIRQKKDTFATGQAAIQIISDRIQHTLEAIQTTADSPDEFCRYLEAELYGLESQGAGDYEIWDEMNDIVESLQDVLAVELELKKKKITAEDAEFATLLASETVLRAERKKLVQDFAVLVHQKDVIQGSRPVAVQKDDTDTETLTVAQNTTLDRFRELTGFEEEGGLRFLKYYEWNLEVAVAACFEFDREFLEHCREVDTQEEEDLERAIRLSLETQAEEKEPSGQPQKDYKGKEKLLSLEPEEPALGQTTNTRDTCQPLRTTRRASPPGRDPGPSRKKNQPEVEDTPEDLAAARARLARIIEEVKGVERSNSPPERTDFTSADGPTEMEKILDEEILNMQNELHRQLASLITLSKEERAVVLASVEEESRFVRQAGPDAETPPPSATPESTDPPSPRTSVDVLNLSSPALDNTTNKGHEDVLQLNERIEPRGSTSPRKRPCHMAEGVINDRSPNKKPRQSPTALESDEDGKSRESTPSRASPVMRGRSAIRRVVESDSVPKSRPLAARTAPAEANVTAQGESNVAWGKESSGVDKRADASRDLYNKVDERRDSTQESRKGSGGSSTSENE